MAKRCAFVLAGLALVWSSAGCCCGHLGYNRCNPCVPGYGAYPSSPCGPAGCPPSYYPPTGSTSYYQGYGASAAIVDPTIPTASTVVPSTTALAPSNPLPTY
jgi:hypothetical protein|uniref:Uncharacterized protein n=1 Tax=Schlesneria paludicola TaxID=360056 RepID=A0A7C4LRN4_9PLAN